MDYDDGKPDICPITMQEYILVLMYLGGHAKEKATSIARNAYIEQWGKTPEEHKVEMDNFDWSKAFKIDK